MATAARAFILFRVTYASPKLKPQPKPPPPPPPPQFHMRRRRIQSPAATVSCLSSGGGISDDFVLSTRKSSFDRGFSVISNMLKRIEPLDNSVISKGVSDSAKDSMKQTISTMLGLLPSDQFSVMVRVAKHPLHSLLISAIVTGYTLWNAEYRMSLMRNLDISVESLSRDSKQSETFTSEREEGKDSGSGGSKVSVGVEELEISPKVFGDLSPEALSYIQQLQSELSNVKEDLNAQKEEIIEIECEKGSRNDLLEYLRSLDSDMVKELSQPSSVEVEDIIHQLAQNVLRRFFKDDPALSLRGNSVQANAENHQDDVAGFSDTISTSRDYVAKLLFWCMLLGHHLRGLENRLHLSCVVGLL